MKLHILIAISIIIPVIGIIFLLNEYIEQKKEKCVKKFFDKRCAWCLHSLDKHGIGLIIEEKCGKKTKLCIKCTDKAI